jgi:hypothetical protein
LKRTEGAFKGRNAGCTHKGKAAKASGRRYIATRLLILQIQPASPGYSVAIYYIYGGSIIVGKGWNIGKAVDNVSSQYRVAPHPENGSRV